MRIFKDLVLKTPKRALRSSCWGGTSVITAILAKLDASDCLELAIYSYRHGITKRVAIYSYRHGIAKRV